VGGAPAYNRLYFRAGRESGDDGKKRRVRTGAGYTCILPASASGARRGHLKPRISNSPAKIRRKSNISASGVEIDCVAAALRCAPALYTGHYLVKPASLL